MLLDHFMNTYFEQLEAQAERTGVSILAACEAEGIARSTLNRWKSGFSTPSEKVAKRIFERMGKMKKS